MSKTLREMQTETLTKIYKMATEEEGKTERWNRLKEAAGCFAISLNKRADEETTVFKANKHYVVKEFDTEEDVVKYYEEVGVKRK